MNPARAENKLPLSHAPGDGRNTHGALSKSAKKRLKLEAKGAAMVTRPLQAKRKKTKRSSAMDVPGTVPDAQLVKDYALTLVAPELGPISAVPDSSPFRSSTIGSGWTLPIPSVVDSATSQVVSGICVYPQLAGHYSTITASANGALSWSGVANIPNYSTLLANFVEYLPVSLSTNLFYVGALQNASGLAFCSQLVAGASGASVGLQPTNLTDLTTSPYTTVVSMTDVENGGARQVWMPMNTPYTTGFNPISAGSLASSYICIVFVGVGTASLINFEVSTHFNYCVEADEAVAYLFPSKPSTGGSDSILGSALRKAVNWVEGIGSTIVRFQEWLEKTTLTKAYDDVFKRGPGRQSGGFMRSARGELASSRFNSSRKGESKVRRFQRRLLAFLTESQNRTLLAELLGIKECVLESIEEKFSAELAFTPERGRCSVRGTDHLRLVGLDEKEDQCASFDEAAYIRISTPAPSPVARVSPKPPGIKVLNDARIAEQGARYRGGPGPKDLELP